MLFDIIPITVDTAQEMTNNPEYQNQRLSTAQVIKPFAAHTSAALCTRTVDEQLISHNKADRAKAAFAHKF